MDKDDNILSTYNLIPAPFTSHQFAGTHYADISTLDENYLYYMWIQNPNTYNKTKYNLGFVRITPSAELTTSTNSTYLFNWGDNANYGFSMSESKDRTGVVFRGIYDINGNLGIPTTAYLYAIKVVRLA